MANNTRAITYTIPVPETKITQQSRQRIGEAIYLLMYLIRSVNWESGRACITHERIAERTGFPPRTIARWLTVLLDAGEITAQRVKRGTLVSITDYEPIARTRGVKHRRPSSSQHPTPDTHHPITPRTAGESATSGEHTMPHAADDHARYGESSIVQILPQVMGPTMFPNAPSPSGDPRRAPDEPRRDETDVPGASRVLTGDEVKEKLARLSDEEYRIVERLAMDDLEHDPRPFYRAFVTRNEDGGLESNTAAGKHMVMRRMADILDQSSTSDALTTDRA